MIPSREEIAKLLVCEDDEPTRELLCSRLELDRYRVLPAATASDALRHARYDRPDLLLLDLELPDAHGIDVLRTIRGGDDERPRLDRDLPIIVVTGYGAEEDRVRGLNEGADDYLVKPYSYGELLARIAKVLERRRPLRGDLLRADDIVVDRVRHLVTVAGRPCRLSRKEFSLLEVLASEPDRVFTKQDLLERIWSYNPAERTRTLDAHASRLRRKLDPAHGRYVVNVWAVGYKLVDS